MVHYCCEVDYEKGDHKFLAEIPDYESIWIKTKP